MSDAWADQLRQIGQNLLTLEINTVVKKGLGAQKMPDVPLALHTLVQAYQDYLAQAGFRIKSGLLTAASFRVGAIGAAATGAMPNDLMHLLEGWSFDDTAQNTLPVPAGPAPKDLATWNDWLTRHDVVADLSNGAESFEALQWAAKAAMDAANAGKVPQDAVFARIRANSRQLKEAALVLERQVSSPDDRGGQAARGLEALRVKRDLGSPQPKQKSQLTYRDRLALLADPDTPNEDASMSRLFGGTLEQTARALFDHPRPSFMVDTDLVVLIRKAWDVGTECVCLQTSLQVDGDVLQQIGDLRGLDRDFILGLHRDAVNLGVGQWRTLFTVLKDLIETLGERIFGGGTA